ncbi:MAG: nucleotidyltransferase domain-containing protein [Anaerolineales bacterium]|uniref:Nucleotidyltransferase domain-containing protein n=1 Tax=Candidatus Desulfolinea nitratireducens TaxID=2841698 RepID=A0A8J6THU1_9CHLR|nr:nucleotidyltransferase domain-containing protein [Candidatus Desulfolinea nitratireducens]MBL6960028.1 nucleotidyltransferase domain-containing protein [Anaerolineales bacterium]
MKKEKISVPKEKIIAFCQRWEIVEFSLFGSILRDDFNAQSDIDVLVVFAKKAEIGLFEIAQMQIELEDIYGRPVDVVEKDSLRNPYRREEILKTAQVLYAD